MSFWGYDSWKAHDPSWDDEGNLGPFCPDCGESVRGRGPEPTLCIPCTTYRLRQQARMQASKPVT